MRHSQPLPAQGSPEFYCDEFQGWVEGNMSKREVMGRRRWTLFLHGSLQLWKLWDFQRVSHAGDQEPTSSSMLNRKGSGQKALVAPGCRVLLFALWPSCLSYSLNFCPMFPQLSQSVVGCSDKRYHTDTPRLQLCHSTGP